MGNTCGICGPNNTLSLCIHTVDGTAYMGRCKGGLDIDETNVTRCRSNNMGPYEFCRDEDGNTVQNGLPLDLVRNDISYLIGDKIVSTSITAASPNTRPECNEKTIPGTICSAVTFAEGTELFTATRRFVRLGVASLNCEDCTPYSAGTTCTYSGSSTVGRNVLLACPAVNN